MVRDLAYGEQRQLELALALVGRPRILLLDEPTAGMSPAETQLDDRHAGRAAARRSPCSSSSTTWTLSSRSRTRVTVLHLGEVLAEGEPQEIQHDPKVISVYFGRYAGAAA